MKTFLSRRNQGSARFGFLGLVVLIMTLIIFNAYTKAAEVDVPNIPALAKQVADTYNNHLGAGYGGHEHMDIKTKLLAVKFHKDTPAELVKALEDEKTLRALTWHLSMDGHRLVAHLVPRAPLAATIVPPLP
jgi:predicted transcriptional regulator